MKTSAPVLAPILRSSAQGRILALIFADPEVERTLTDLAQRSATTAPTVLREVQRAEDAGLVVSRRVGQARLVRANPQGRFYGPVREIVLGTFGPPLVIGREFEKVPGVEAILLFGSWVARYLGEPGRGPHDVDVLVVGGPDRHQLYAAAERTEAALGLPVQVTVRTPKEWVDGDAFVATVKERPLLVVGLNLDNDVLVDLVARAEAGR